MPSLSTRTFVNANREPVPYDGSPITWRVSAYSLIVKEGQLLLAKSRLEKFYDVIGGGIEIGETIEETLHREALEEGGAHIKIGQLLFSTVDWFYHRKGVFYQTLQLFYESELVGPLTQPTDPEIEWSGLVPFSEVETKYQLSNSIDVVNFITQYLSTKTTQQEPHAPSRSKI